MKLLFIPILVFASIPVFGQIQKGNWLVGGNVDFSFAFAKSVNTANVQFAPNVGYFFLDKFAGGLRINFDLQKDYRSGFNTTNLNFSPSPFLRYYLRPVSKQINIFLEGSYGYSWSWYHTPSFSSDFHFWKASSIAGLSVFLNSRTALELTLRYSYSTRGVSDTVKTNLVALGAGFQIHL